MLNETLSLLRHTETRLVQDAIKQSAKIDFMARMSGVSRPEDIERERKNFTKSNLSEHKTKSGVNDVDQKFIIRS